MALTVLQYEEFAELLRRVPALVDAMQDRSPDYPRDVLQWLKQVETALENNRSPAVAQLAGCRAMLIQAGRGIRDPDVPMNGRPTTRKVQDATATLVLQRSVAVVEALIADRQRTFDEAERMAGHLVSVARLKGWLAEDSRPRPHQEVLQHLMSRAAQDDDLGNVQAHLVSLVGLRDSLIFLDRALSRLR
jgi:hypothetical protein